MKQLVYLASLTLFFGLQASNKKGNKFDASGTYETDEVIVSSELGGKILSLQIEEGQGSPKTVSWAWWMPQSLLTEQQVEASINALNQKTADVNPQVKFLRNQLAVQQSQLNNLTHERARIENLIKADAATGKQLDDINAQIDVAVRNMAVTTQQINVQQSNIATQNRSILSEAEPLRKRAAQIKDQAGRANILNPVQGTIITKYAMEGEITSPGKALYKIADLRTMTLRAYITGSQLSQVKLGQTVKVFTDDGKNKYRETTGTISWISDKAEFTPKTIQTKEERANLVYAIKVRVKNDGLLKIGMYGEIVLSR
jgi:HlyD family secretion protein